MLLSLSLGVGLAPRAAEACSSVAWLELVRPAEGDEVHPGSASLLFIDYGASLSELYKVAVDGEPATLVIDSIYPRNQHTGGQWKLVRVEPPPTEGATVTILQCHRDGDPQYQSCDDGWAFEPLLEFTAGVGDEMPPPDAGDVELTHEFVDFHDICYGRHRVRFSVELSGLEQGSDPDVIYVAEVRDSKGELVFERSVRFDEPGSVATLQDYLEHRPPDAAGHCVSVRAVDLSGNISTIAERCGSDEVVSGGTGSTGGEGDHGSSNGGSTGGGSMPAPTPTTGGGTALAVPETTAATQEGDSPHDDGGVVGRGCVCSAREAAFGWWTLGLLAFGRLRRGRP